MATENGVLIRKHPQRPPLPQDEGWSWMIVLGVFIYAFFMVGVFIYAFFMVGIAKSYSLFLLEFAEYFRVSIAFATMPLNLAGIIYAFGVLIVSRFPYILPYQLTYTSVCLLKHFSPTSSPTN
ncbi:hypothetical protein RRG08_064198 [Elysia crispata]|uniref:Uncharacterized protein n=1 Tax=Elysia crispata TaxID=231223 RepID=A0AAE0ZGR4_9GAST|nr:hypothetical protein RRG08_064198 [Elysia crispata]